MTSRDFCFWLQGFFEITDTKKLTPEQVEIVKDHLKMVFNDNQKQIETPPQQKEIYGLRDLVLEDQKLTVTC